MDDCWFTVKDEERGSKEGELCILEVDNLGHTVGIVIGTWLSLAVGKPFWQKVFPHTPSKNFFSASYGCFGYFFCCVWFRLEPTAG